MTTVAAAIEIPEELRARKQWVLWRTERRDGKPTKVPLVARLPKNRGTDGTQRRFPASTTDPNTWRRFEEAQAVWRSSEGFFDGVGYVFSKHDPYAGVDFDDCIDANGELNPVVAEYVAQLDSYTEISPSGTGLHVIVRAKVDGRKKTNDTPWGGVFETYSEARFFTMTGNAYRVSVPR